MKLKLWKRTGTTALLWACCLQAGPARGEEITDVKISALDILMVDVVNEKEISRPELKVTAKGEITVPFLGRLVVAGKTTSEVQEKIRELLEKDYLVDPQVIVQVKERAKRKVNVDGEVNRPGQIDLPEEKTMTVLDAIAGAGGTTRIAKESQIAVIRPGVEKPFKFDLKKLRENPNLNKEFILEPGDTIHVDQSKW